jgi:hypothetical protein
VVALVEVLDVARGELARAVTCATTPANRRPGEESMKTRAD